MNSCFLSFFKLSQKFNPCELEQLDDHWCLQPPPTCLLSVKKLFRYFEDVILVEYLLKTIKLINRTNFPPIWTPTREYFDHLFQLPPIFVASLTVMLFRIALMMM